MIDLSSILSLCEKIFKHKDKLSFFYEKYLYSKRDKILKEINKHPVSKDNFTLLTFDKFEINDQGSLENFSEISDAEIQKVRENDMIPGLGDEYCAVVTEQLDWTRRPLIIPYRKIRYSMTKVLQRRNDKATIISSNTLVFCLESRCILLHERSDKNSDMGNAIHTIGGGYQPHGINGQRDKSLIHTAKREMMEELGIEVRNEQLESLPAILIDEYGISFLQCAFLGLRISKIDLDKIDREEKEGVELFVTFDELEGYLKRLNSNFENANQGKNLVWTPSGWAHIMIWLGLGAPGVGLFCKFNGKSPQAVYKSVLQSTQQ